MLCHGVFHTAAEKPGHSDLWPLGYRPKLKSYWPHLRMQSFNICYLVKHCESEDMCSDASFCWKISNNVQWLHCTHISLQLQTRSPWHLTFELWDKVGFIIPCLQGEIILELVKYSIWDSIYKWSSRTFRPVKIHDLDLIFKVTK